MVVYFAGVGGRRKGTGNDAGVYLNERLRKPQNTLSCLYTLIIVIKYVVIVHRGV